MSEFFLELFSEEIPSSLQKSLRRDLLDDFNKFFSSKSISYKKSSSYSTPNRAVLLFEGLQKQVILKSQEIRGPNINAPQIATDGFIRSNNISKKELFKKKIEKGEFYFFKTKSKKLNTNDLLEEFVPLILKEIQWKKSMKWGKFDLNWGRPLKSILAIYNKKKLVFNFHHLVSSNSTFIDKEFEDNKKIFHDFKSYEKFFQNKGIIIDHDKRKKIIEKGLEKVLIKKNLEIINNEKLIEEVVNLTDKPHILECSFDKKFLSIPKEILILTMQSHQKYFPLFTKKQEITNEFLVVSNNKDKKGLIKIGNERVVEARLNDADFFWTKDKSQNLVKKVSELKTMNVFKGLGTYFDKVQRMRKLGALISDELLISKEKVELSASICKTDLISESVGEFPELQGIMGSHISNAQGFDKDIVQAIKEQYLPVGLNTTVPRKPYSITISLTDRIDTLVGFFGINEKPSSSKDPYALRRVALGIIRIIIENKRDIKINDLISHSINNYFDQGFTFSNDLIFQDLINFLKERFKYYLKENSIRHDIIESTSKIFNLNNISTIFKKAKSLNKIINKPIGMDIVSSYKRASSILSSEIKDIKRELSNTTDSGIFKNNFEKDLYNKTNELKKHISEISRDKDFDEILMLLSSAKKEVFDFFDNVKVNDDNDVVRKNRLELLNFFCKTYETFLDFHQIREIND